MAANPFFSGRIPKDLSDRINQYCAETGESKTHILINALAKYLDFPINPLTTTGVSIEMFSELEKRVTELENELKKTPVISLDNKKDTNTNTIDDLITSDIKTDNSLVQTEDENVKQDLSPVTETQTQLYILEPDNQNKRANENQQILKTAEIPNLPGLEKMKKNQILNSLRNAKSSGKTEVKIGCYIMKYYGKEEKVNGALLWEVIKTS